MAFPKLNLHFGKKKDVTDYEKGLPPLPPLDRNLPSMEPLPAFTRREVTMESANADNVKSKIDLMTTQLDNLNIKYETLNQKIEQIQKMITEIYRMAKS
ncbi:MAG: hypothetical protein J4452_02055 [Candidatus Aenigmarchaeota archaeon]|nr:hypothetical protein [Candidatus Aenigmarchaeota archaeon]